LLCNGLDSFCVNILSPLSLSRSLSHSLAPSRSRARSLSLARALSLSLSLSCTRTHTLSPSFAASDSTQRALADRNSWKPPESTPCRLHLYIPMTSPYERLPTTTPPTDGWRCFHLGAQLCLPHMKKQILCFDYLTSIHVIAPRICIRLVLQLTGRPIRVLFM